MGGHRRLLEKRRRAIAVGRCSPRQRRPRRAVTGKEDAPVPQQQRVCPRVPLPAEHLQPEIASEPGRCFQQVLKPVAGMHGVCVGSGRHRGERKQTLLQGLGGQTGVPGWVRDWEKVAVRDDEGGWLERVRRARVERCFQGVGPHRVDQKHAVVGHDAVCLRGEGQRELIEPVAPGSLAVWEDEQAIREAHDSRQVTWSGIPGLRVLSWCKR